MNSEVDFAAGGIVLVNKKVLLVKNRLREEYKKNYSSGFWGFPKGHLEEGETPLKAAEREVFEETGFEVKCVGDKPIAESRYSIEYGETIQKTVWFYEMKVVKEFVKEPDDEIEEIAIVTEKKALELLTYEEDKKILKYVFNR
tara:strand:- start:874 stop:1302 length:429 start_codon:yes stop_codon:yes gene_type:complete